MNLRGRTPLAVDPRQIAQALFGDADSVASRYRAASYGKVEFVGSERDIVDPVTLAEPADFCNTGLSRLAGAAEDELRRRAIPLAPYQHVVFVLPKDAPCWWTGVGDIGGKRVWVKATTAKALQHELGHNFGMNHAVRWRGSDADDSDFMGSGAVSLNAPHVVEMGWLRDHAGKVVELTEAGDVTLEALETAPRHSALPKVAIVHPAPGANTYYLSYRASGAADPLPDEFVRGVNIHIAGKARQNGGLTYFVTSLSDGAAYHDGPLIVQQLSHTAGDRVTFHISFTGTGQAAALGAPAGAARDFAVPRLREMSRPSRRTVERRHAADSVRLPWWPKPTVDNRSRGRCRLPDRQPNERQVRRNRSRGRRRRRPHPAIAVRQGAGSAMGDRAGQRRIRFAERREPPLHGCAGSLAR